MSTPHPRLTCDFENDLCDWINEDSRDSEDWLRNSGLTKTQLNFNKENIPFKTGPQPTNNSRPSELNDDILAVYLKLNHDKN